MAIRAYSSFLLLLFWGTRVIATTGPADLCVEAARIASEKMDVPYDVLLAVSLTETGHRPSKGGPLQPWPWASNQAGDGNWFDTRDQAVAHVENQLAQGVTNIDIGCFQLNHRWHSMHFSSVDAMFDPLANALYAATLLSRHYKNSGDWAEAAGAFHSATPEFADRYRSRFDPIYAAISDAGTEILDALPSVARVNGFPLLLAGSKTSGPSLFPSLAPGRRLIGD